MKSLLQLAFIAFLLAVLSPDGWSQQWTGQPVQIIPANTRLSLFQPIQEDQTDPPSPSFEDEPVLDLPSEDLDDKEKGEGKQPAQQPKEEMDEDVDEDDEIDEQIVRRSTHAEMIAKINPFRRPMSAISLDLREPIEATTPEDESEQLTNYSFDSWTNYSAAPVTFAWAAPNIRYQPLYFENVALERYGQTRGPWLEVARSGLHFWNSAVFLGYHAKFDHIKSCDYPLGFCRPGERAPRTRQLQWWGW